MADTPEPHEPNAPVPQILVTASPAAPPPPRRSRATVDWKAAGRKAWETRRQNAARHPEKTT
jgi:hypothetical protein